MIVPLFVPENMKVAFLFSVVLPFKTPRLVVSTGNQTPEEQLQAAMFFEGLDEAYILQAVGSYAPKSSMSLRHFASNR